MPNLLLKIQKTPELMAESNSGAIVQRELNKYDEHLLDSLEEYLISSGDYMSLPEGKECCSREHIFYWLLGKSSYGMFDSEFNEIPFAGNNELSAFATKEKLPEVDRNGLYILNFVGWESQHSGKLNLKFEATSLEANNQQKNRLHVFASSKLLISSKESVCSRLYTLFHILFEQHYSRHIAIDLAELFNQPMVAEVNVSASGGAEVHFLRFPDKVEKDFFVERQLNYLQDYANSLGYFRSETSGNWQKVQVNKKLTVSLKTDAEIKAHVREFLHELY